MSVCRDTLVYKMWATHDQFSQAGEKNKLFSKLCNLFLIFCVILYFPITVSKFGGKAIYDYHFSFYNRSTQYYLVVLTLLKICVSTYHFNSTGIDVEGCTTWTW